MKLDYDIAIIGAGPAGCACALALHGQGLRVALIDRAAYPRDKICGDSIPGPSFKAIDSINKNWGDQIRALAEKLNITRSTVYLSYKNAISYEWLSYSYNSKRIDFDHALFQLVKNETDTIIIENKRLQKITTELNYTQCEFHDGSSMKAAMVIGCDGAHSVVKRGLVDSSGNEGSTFSAIRAYYKGIEGIKAGDNEFHLIKEADGYFWIFPLKDGWANVGFGLAPKTKKGNETPKDIRKTLAEITQSPAFVNRFKNATLMGKVNGFGLPIWTKKEPISGTRFILCGDAASLIDPLQGHGIDKAIWSGVIAATQVVDCFRENNFSADYMKNYDAMVYKKFGRELSRNYWVMRLLIRFPLLNTAFFKLFSNQKALNYIIRKLKF
jgi:geranylgeranyl reductase family protein